MRTPNTEPVKSRFDVVCSFDDTIHIVSIQEVDMSGWTLYECYFMWSGDVMYLYQEEESAPLMHIDMQDEVPETWAIPLIEAIKESKAA